MRKPFNIKSAAGYVLLVAILIALLYLLLESRQRSQKIDNVLKQIPGPT
jgi:hypothetical protein